MAFTGDADVGVDDNLVGKNVEEVKTSTQKNRTRLLLQLFFAPEQNSGSGPGSVRGSCCFPELRLRCPSTFSPTHLVFLKSYSDKGLIVRSSDLALWQTPRPKQKDCLDLTSIKANNKMS